MRVLRTTHPNIIQLAYGWDSGTLYGVSRLGKNWDDRVLDCWNLGDGTREAIDCCDVRPTHVSPLPGGRIVVGGTVGSGEGVAATVAVINPADMRHVRYLPPGSANTVTAVSPTGDRILALGAGRGIGECIVAYPFPFGSPIQAEWNVKVASRSGPDSYIAGVAFAFGSSGSRFVSIESTWFHGAGVRSVARWRAMKTGKPVGKPFPVAGDFSYPLRFAVVGTRLILFRSATLIGYDLTTPGDPVKRANAGTRKHFVGVAAHPDGRRVFATCNDETLREYDAETLQELRAYEWKVGKLRCLAVAPDGATAAAGSETGKVVVWDLE